MLTVALGRTGERIPALGLGLWQAGSPGWGGSKHLEEIGRGVLYAVSLGLTFFDTAEVYGKGKSEILLGRILGHSDDVFIASKIAGFRTSFHSILKGAMGIKRRLKRDYIDLLQYHWPPPVYSDLCSIMRSMEKTIDLGIARYIGVCNFNRKMFEEALNCMKKHELVSNQVQYSLGYRIVEQELKPYLEEKSVTLIAWSPLAKGAVLGRRRADNIARLLDPVFRRVSRDPELYLKIRRIAVRNDMPASAVALRWLIEKGAVPIPGFTRSSRIREYFVALSKTLPEKDIEELDRQSYKYTVLYGSYDPFKLVRYIPSFIVYGAYMVSPGF